MSQEPMESALLELLLGLAEKDDIETIDLGLAEPAERWFQPRPANGRHSPPGRRILREHERLVLGTGASGFLVELQEMGVLSAATTERLVDRLVDELPEGEVAPRDALREAATLLRAESPNGLGRQLFWGDLGGPMTAH